MPWEETENYIRSGHKEASDTCRTITLSDEQGLKAIYCKYGDQWAISSYLFAKDKGWTMDKAKQWFEQHRESIQVLKPLTFEGKLLEATQLPNGKYKIRGVAIHPLTTYHPMEQFSKRVYYAERLKQAAHTLTGKPISEDHRFPLPNCFVSLAKWDDGQGGVYFEGEVTAEVAEKLKGGYYNGSVSVSVNPWRRGGGLEFVDGVAPYGFEFEELSLLHSLPPGDPQTWVELMEALSHEQKGGMNLEKEELEKIVREAIEAQMKPVLEALEQLKNKEPEVPAELAEALKPYPEETRQKYISLFKQGNLPSDWRKMLEAEWTTEYINDLPDECFAYIEPGGEKDEQGKTKPRSLRHLPYRDAQGRPDADHVRNALARLPLTDIPAEAKEEAKRKLCAAAKELEIESEVCGLTESTYLVEARKQILALMAEKAEIEKQLKQSQEKLQRFREAVERVLPPVSILRAWGNSGGTRTVQEIRRVLQSFP